MSRAGQQVTQVQDGQNYIYTTGTVPGSYTGPAVTTATSNLYSVQQPGSYYTTQTYAAPVTTTQTYVNGQYAVGGAQTATYTTGYAVGSAAHKAVAEDIPVESRIEYIPFEKKYIEYEQIEKVYQVPVETEVIEYEEVVRNERIPIERTITDYYAVETQVEYIRREIEETVMVEEPVEKVYERVQYIPVETQIVHYPERDNYVPAKTQVRTEYVGVQGQGQSTVIQNSNAQASKVETTYQTYGGVQGGSRVGQTTYVSGGSGVNVAATSYQPGYSGATYTTGTQGVTYTTGTQGGVSYSTVPAGYTTQQYSTSYPAYQYVNTSNQPATVYTTTNTGYVAGGSGVRGATGGYVTGGSGVRGTNTYVSSGSNIKQTSYETNPGYY